MLVIISVHKNISCNTDRGVHVVASRQQPQRVKDRIQYVNYVIQAVPISMLQISSIIIVSVGERSMTGAGDFCE